MITVKSKVPIHVYWSSLSEVTCVRIGSSGGDHASSVGFNALGFHNVQEQSMKKTGLKKGTNENGKSTSIQLNSGKKKEGREWVGSECY